MLQVSPWCFPQEISPLWTKLCPPQNSYHEALNPNATVLGDRTCKKVTKAKWGHRVGPWSNRNRVFVRRETHQKCVCTEKRPGGDTVRWWPSASHGERPREKPSLFTDTIVLDLQPPALCEMNFCFLSYPVWYFPMAAQEMNTVQKTSYFCGWS